MRVPHPLQLLVPPMQLVHRYLLKPKAALALARNLRRDHIDEEVRAHAAAAKNRIEPRR